MCDLLLVNHLAWDYHCNSVKGHLLLTGRLLLGDASIFSKKQAELRLKVAQNYASVEKWRTVGDFSGMCYHPGMQLVYLKPIYYTKAT